MKAVNLLPVDRRSASGSSGGLDAGRKNLLIVCAVVGVLLIAGLSFMVWSSSSSVGDKQAKLQQLQAQIAASTSAASIPVSAGTRKATVVGLLSQRVAWDQFLTTLSKVMPEDVWLESLESTTAGAAATLATAQAAATAAATAATPTTTTSSSSTPPPAPVAAPPSSTFTMSGYTYSQPSVARMLRRLNLVPWLTGVTLVSSTKSILGSDAVVEFSVKAAVISPETSP